MINPAFIKTACFFGVLVLSAQAVAGDDLVNKCQAVEPGPNGALTVKEGVTNMLGCLPTHPRLSNNAPPNTPPVCSADGAAVQRSYQSSVDAICDVVHPLSAGPGAPKARAICKNAGATCFAAKTEDACKKVTYGRCTWVAPAPPPQLQCNPVELNADKTVKAIADADAERGCLPTHPRLGNAVPANTLPICPSAGTGVTPRQSSVDAACDIEHPLSAGPYAQQARNICKNAGNTCRAAKTEDACKKVTYGRCVWRP